MPFVRLTYVDKMLNAFTMHSFFTTMPSKNAVTMPLALVRFSFYPPLSGGARKGRRVNNSLLFSDNSINSLIIHQIQSL